MEESTTRPVSILEFRQRIEAQLRRHIREALDVSLREELASALPADRHERSDGRCGYRNGTIERTVTTATGPRLVTVPRGRVQGADGTTREFHSQLLPRYARRTGEVDDAILRCYLEGP
jgi:transposase-like protein